MRYIFANHKLERDNLQGEIASLKVKIEHFEKNAKNRSDQLKKLSELSISRNKTLSRFESSLNLTANLGGNVKEEECAHLIMCTFTVKSTRLLKSFHFPSSIVKFVHRLSKVKTC